MALALDAGGKARSYNGFGLCRSPAPAGAIARIVSILSLVLMTFVTSIAPAAAAVDLFDLDGQPVTLSAWMRTREYVWSYFAGLPTGPGSQNAYNYEANVLRLGLGYQLDGFNIFVEGMNPTFMNLPDAAIAPAPRGNLGLGANYYAVHENAVDSNYFLKQGFVRFHDWLLEGFDVKGGRFEFFDGAEMTPEDPQLRWLVTNEIQQRLIGNFGFSDVMRSFDGATATYGTQNWNAIVMYGVPTKGVFDLNGMDEISATDVLYTALNAGPNPLWGDSLGRVFYIWYDDNRGLVPVDNEPAAAAAKNRRPISIDTLGADFVHIWQVGPGNLDVLIWGAYQFGSWGDQAQAAYSYVGALGYRFTDIPWKPWLRTQYTFGSGDSTPKNNVHGTFFQILPTPRIYALDPVYNMMNNMDLGEQLILSPFSSVEWRSDIDGLWLASSHDLWYQGGGAYNTNTFGYSGHKSFGKNYLGTVMDSGVNWKVCSHLNLNFYAGHMFGGSVVGTIYPNGRGETFGYAESIITF